MPQIDGPKGLNDLLKTVYDKALDTYKGDKGKASATAWAQAKASGWFKSKSGDWKKKSESESSWYQWQAFWRNIEYSDPYNIGSLESLGLVEAGGSDLVGYQARILMAVPGKSLNGRVYLPETLRQAAQPYIGKPFILDHDIEHAERVVGIINDTSYGVQEGYDGKPREGLWGMALGMCTREMFDRLHGRGPVPPLIRGVSIGGQGDGQYNADGGVLIKNFQPAELSITAFPGIPEAQIAQIGMITESYRKAGVLNHASMKKSKTKETVRVPIREGPGQTNTPVMGSNPRPALRGITASNDSEPRIDLTGGHTVPQPTYGMDGKQVNPYDSQSGGPTTQLATGAQMYGNLKGQSSTEGSTTGSGYGSKSSRDAKSWSPKTPSLGRTTTATPGFGKLGPSGTGISDQQEEEEERQRVQTVVASLQNDLNKVLYGMRTGKMPQEAKVDVSKPEEEEEEEKAKGEEEEEEEEHLLLRHLARMKDQKLNRELDYNLGDQRSPSQGPQADTTVSNYQRTINPGVDVTNSPPNEGQGQGEGITHVSSGRSASASPREFTAANPVRSGGEEEEEEEEERTIRNRIIRLRMARLFPGIEATGQTMPKSSTSVSKNYPKLGNTTTDTPGFGKLSPSGTGLRGQPEGEEEEEEHYILNKLHQIDTKRSARREAGSFDKQEEEEEEEERRHLARSLSRIYMSRAQREQGMKPSLDQPDEKPQGEEEEEVRGPSLRQEEEDAMNPLAKAAGANVPQEWNQPLANLQYLTGPYDKASRLRSTEQRGAEFNTAPDIVPIEGSAPSLALGTGQTLWHQFIRRNNQPSEQQLKQMMEGWNQLRQPKVQALPKLRLNMKESAVPIAPRGSASAIPTLPGVPARGVMSNNGTLSQPYQTAFHADTRAVQKWGLDKLQELDKRPYQQRPFDQYNSAHALYKQYLAEHMVTN